LSERYYSPFFTFLQHKKQNSHDKIQDIPLLAEFACPI